MPAYAAKSTLSLSEVSQMTRVFLQVEVRQSCSWKMFSCMSHAARGLRVEDCTAALLMDQIAEKSLVVYYLLRC